MKMVLLRINSQPRLDPPKSKWRNGQSQQLNQTFIKRRGCALDKTLDRYVNSLCTNKFRYFQKDGNAQELSLKYVLREWST